MGKRNKHNKLTKEQRKAIWEQTQENAGAGWKATGEYTSRAPRYPEYERVNPKGVDEEFK